MCSRIILVLGVMGLVCFHETLATSTKDVCGEIIYLNKADPKGSIISKVYTKNTVLTNCTWEIVAPSPYVVVLNFSYFSLSDHQNCTAENVTVISKGENNVQHQHGVFCGMAPPQKVMSLGSTLKITFSFASSVSKFEADLELDYNECEEYNGGCHHKCYNTIGGSECHCEKGFKLHSNKRTCVKDSCGGLIYGQKYSSGLVTSPGFPYIYPNNQKCTWEIVSPPLHKIMLNFTYFNVDSGNNCTNDNITIYSRLDAVDFHKHGSFCGSSKPPVIVSKRNVLRVEFLSDGSITQQGFVALYHVVADECGESNGGCQHDCVNTFSGHECSCGPGFALTNDKHSCKEICGGHFFDFNGTISSPLFPENYPSNQRCQWNIIAQKGYKIRLEFYHFDLEDSHRCNGDNLTLYSRESVDVHKKLGVFCGTEIPPVIDSDATNLIIQFQSDALFSHTGFVATYSLVNVDECAVNNGGCQHDCCNTHGSYKCSCRPGFMLHPDGHTCVSLECSGNLTTGSGSFSSIHYPGNYSPNTNCLWHIKTKEGNRVQLTIEDFELEEQQNCLFDHLSVYDGDMISDETLKGKYCGTNESRAIAAPIVASGTEMVVEFRSDSTVQKKGFNATFTSICGGNLTATSIAQDLYSNGEYGFGNYKRNLLCDWYIEAPLGRRVRFRVMEMELEGNCAYDYLEISERVVHTNKVYGKYCASNVPDKTSELNTLKIQFKTDGSNQYRGFAAKYFIA